MIYSPAHSNLKALLFAPVLPTMVFVVMALAGLLFLGSFSPGLSVFTLINDGDTMSLLSVIIMLLLYVISLYVGGLGIVCILGILPLKFFKGKLPTFTFVNRLRASHKFRLFFVIVGLPLVSLIGGSLFFVVFSLMCLFEFHSRYSDKNSKSDGYSNSAFY